MREPRILFVSKPIVAPWNDGSKNLVRDVAGHLTRARPTVMVTSKARDAARAEASSGEAGTTSGASGLGARVELEPLYRDAGRFAPAATANARVALRLLTGDPHDVWHFVFAPNPLSSGVASVASRARRSLGWKGKVVQTVASAPRTFDGAAGWIFGDSVVTLSEHTRAGLRRAGVTEERLRVIPPCARAPRVLDEDEIRLVRSRHQLGVGPVVLYPGDYEVSQGAQTVAAAVPAIVAAIPEVTVVFACRKKTEAANDAQKLVERELDRLGVANRTRHLGEVSDMAELLAVASVVAFPVDDLYGKVDLPIVLLEAMALGIPIVVARGGPLESLDFVPSVAPADHRALAEHVVTLLGDEDAAAALGHEGKRVYSARYTPEVVARAYDDLYAELLG